MAVVTAALRVSRRARTRASRLMQVGTRPRVQPWPCDRRLAMERDAAGALTLGPIHGRIRPCDQGVEIIPVVGVDGDADARRQADDMAVQLGRRAERLDQLLSDRLGVARLGQLGQQDEELVATVATDRVHPTHGRDQTIGDQT